MMRVRILNSLSALFCLVLTTGLIQAQSVTATINGTVHDSAGASIPDADITVTNEGTSVSTSAKSNSEGSFTFSGLTSGTYTVGIAKAGFGGYSEKGIFLGPTVVRAVNATLTVGQVSTQITVEASAVQVQTETSQISNSVAQEQVETLPLNGRNYQSLSALMPGVVNLGAGQTAGQGGFNTSNTMSINGMGQSGTLYELDGVWNMNTGNMTQTTIMPNPDSIQEVRTLQNNFSPKYSLLGASIVLVQTRSGTKDFHGTLWEYFRNDKLDARNFFSPKVLAEKQNIFGGTIGGPVMIPKLYNRDRNKTFFFYTIQGTVRHVASTQTGATATQDMRNGLFNNPIVDPATETTYGDASTGTLFPRNSAGQYVIPTSRLNPQSLALYNALANLPNNTAAGFNNFINTNPETISQTDQQIKIDQIIGNKTRLMGEYFDTRQTDNLPAEEWAGSPFTNNTQSFLTRSKLAELQMTTTISATMVNQISLGMNNYVVDLNTNGLLYNDQVSGWSTNLPYSGFLSNRLPQINFSGGWSSIGVTQSQPLIHASDLEDTLTDDWSWMKGKHFIEGGFNLVFSTKRQNAYAQSNGTWQFSGRFTNDPIADYLLGTAASLVQESAERRVYMHGTMFTPYIQDTWKVTPHFTLNYGVRFEYMPLPHAQNGWETAFDPARFDATTVPAVNTDGTITSTAGYNPLNGIITNGVGGVPINFTDKNKYYWAPNAGFAWDVLKDGKTSLRGGYGITYSRVFSGVDCSYSCANNYPNVQSIQLVNTSFPNPVGSGQVAPAGAPGMNTVDLNAKVASVYTYSLSLEHQFGSWFASVAGAGNVARSLPITFNLNQPKPTGGYNYNPAINSGTYTYVYGPYQGYGGINIVRSIGNSYWDALMLSLRHPVGKGLFITGAYTYSHTLSQAPGTSIFGGGNSPQDSYNLNGNYGNSPLDLRHLLSFSYIWQIPFMQHAKGFKGAMLGGWKYSGIITAQSGFALSPGLSVSNQGLATRPDVSGTALTYDKTVASWFNTDAFVKPAAGYFGNAGVGIIRGPGLVNFDMALYKQFRITEHNNLEFRGELFNIFNHTNFSTVSTSLGSGNFGQITAARDPRIVEFSLRYRF